MMGAPPRPPQMEKESIGKLTASVSDRRSGGFLTGDQAGWCASALLTLASHKACTRRYPAALMGPIGPKGPNRINGTAMFTNARSTHTPNTFQREAPSPFSAPAIRAAALTSQGIEANSRISPFPRKIADQKRTLRGKHTISRYSTNPISLTLSNPRKPWLPRCPAPRCS